MEIKPALQNMIGSYGKLDQADKSAAASDDKKASAKTSKASSGDKSSLSSEAKLRAEAYGQAMGTPDIRAEKVTAIKEQVDNGTYNIDSRKIAESLLKSDAEILG